MFTLREVECLGSCANAPMIQLNDDYYVSPLYKPGLHSVVGRTDKCHCRAGVSDSRDYH